LKHAVKADGVVDEREAMLVDFVKAMVDKAARAKILSSFTGKADPTIPQKNRGGHP
jgi:hypothetical protein